MKNEEVRQRVVVAYKNTADKDHRNILQRRQIIEKRKEDLENQSIQKVCLLNGFLFLAQNSFKSLLSCL